MFKFNFGQVVDYPLDLEDTMPATDDDEEMIVTPREERQEGIRTQDACEEVSLDDLIKTLSPIISYTPLIIRSGKDGENGSESTSITRSIIIPRRDLYDARFQIISEGALSDEEGEEGEDKDDNDHMEGVEDILPTVLLEEMDSPTLPPLILDNNNRSTRRNNRHHYPAAPADLEYIDAPSDVIPNIYEGGLKTWECSIDVVEYLSQLDGLPFRGKAILEVGCGTAIPAVYLLQSLFNEASPFSTNKRTVIHLQDYNKIVLELVTLPNLILAWYSSKAADSYRSQLSLPTPDPATPGEVSIDPKLVDAFLGSLKDHVIQLRFWAGSWSTFEPRGEGDGPFDLIITSETIYRSANVSSLLSVLRSASVVAPKPGFFANLATLSGRSQDVAPIVLVAAKVLYFGVGGSVDEFKSMAKNAGATVTTVLDIEIGVGRRILKLEFTW